MTGIGTLDAVDHQHEKARSHPLHRRSRSLRSCGLPALDKPTKEVVLALEKAQVRSALRYDLEHHLRTIDLVLA